MCVGARVCVYVSVCVFSPCQHTLLYSLLSLLGTLAPDVLPGKDISFECPCWPCRGKVVHSEFVSIVSLCECVRFMCACSSVEGVSQVVEADVF